MQGDEICSCVKFETNRSLQMEVFEVMASIGILAGESSPRSRGFGALLPINDCFFTKLYIAS